MIWYSSARMSHTSNCSIYEGVTFLLVKGVRGKCSTFFLGSGDKHALAVHCKEQSNEQL